MSSGLVSAFVAVMEDDEDTAWVDAIYDDCLAKIAAGGGEISGLTSSSLNGKSFTKSLRMDALQLLQVCREALDIYNGKAVAATQVDFRSMTR